VCASQHSQPSGPCASRRSLATAQTPSQDERVPWPFGSPLSPPCPIHSPSTTLVDQHLAPAQLSARQRKNAHPQSKERQSELSSQNFLTACPRTRQLSHPPTSCPERGNSSTCQRNTRQTRLTHDERAACGGRHCLGTYGCRRQCTGASSFTSTTLHCSGITVTLTPASPDPPGGALAEQASRVNM
jgi:hypothetical protein